MKAMILAAGRGKRLRPLTDTISKPLLKVGEYALIEHLLHALSKNGFKEIVVNVAYLAQQIIQTLGNGSCYGVTIEYSHEPESQGLETGGGVYHALPLLGKNPFLVLSGDIWTDYPFHKLKSQPLTGLVHLVLVDNPPDYPQGDFCLQEERVVESPGTRLTYGNIGIYHPDLFTNCQPGFFPLAPLLKDAIKTGRATGEHFKGQWLNVGTLEALEKLRMEMIG
jgi:N-acetyl-alpha-D-muramate 1-phosphate uridylyltransferase